MAFSSIGPEVRDDRRTPLLYAHSIIEERFPFSAFTSRFSNFNNKPNVYFFFLALTGGKTSVKVLEMRSGTEWMKWANRVCSEKDSV